MVLDSIFISLLSLFTFISVKIKVAEYYFELRCPQYVEVQLTFIINCNKPESEEERRILPFVACGTLKTDKGKYRLSRL